MIVEIELNLDDWIKYNEVVQKKYQREVKGITGSFWGDVGVYAILILLFTITFNNLLSWDWPTALFVLTFFIAVSGLLIWNIHKMQQEMMPREGGIYLGQHEFTFSREGITSKGDGYNSNHEWKRILSIERNSGLIIIFMDSVFGFIFPEDQLSDPDGFYDQIMEFYTFSQV